MAALTEKQWAVLEPLLSKQNFKKGGRPRSNERKTFDGILWVLKTGAQWNEMPRRYGSYTTAWRRLKTWEKMGHGRKYGDDLLPFFLKKTSLNLKLVWWMGHVHQPKKGELGW